jgi:hypothetical protein
MKPIETVYKNYRFRSRLEARWAVFFDALAIEWVYEKEGYDLGDAGWYLPDFWFPHPVKDLANEGWGLWGEIKPLPATDEEMRRAIALAAQTKHNVLIFQGNIGEGEYEVTKINTVHFDPPKLFTGLRFVDDDGFMQLKNDTGMASSPGAMYRDLDAAFRLARSARFEHGAKP